MLNPLALNLAEHNHAAEEHYREHSVDIYSDIKPSRLRKLSIKCLLQKRKTQ